MPRYPEQAPGGAVRLQVYLAHAGVASRRASEALIAEGRVRVNGAVVTAPGTKVRPGHDVVAVDGTPVETVPLTWIALHKPKGYVSTRNDPYGRRTVYDLLPEKYHTLFHVGRLDRDSEGLLLMTNDGELANRLLHPSFGVTKEYQADVMGEMSASQAHELVRGVELDDGLAKAEKVERLHKVDEGVFRLRVIMREGKKREVRRMLDELGHPVRRLVRKRFGPIELGELPSGKWRVVSKTELAAIANPERAEPRRTRPASSDEAETPGERVERAYERAEKAARSAPKSRAASKSGAEPRGLGTPARKSTAKAGARTASRRGDDEGKAPRKSTVRLSDDHAGAGEERPRRTRPGTPSFDRPAARKTGDRDAAGRPPRGSSAPRARREEGDESPRRPSSRPAAPRGRSGEWEEKPRRSSPAAGAPRGRKDEGEERPRRTSPGTGAPRGRRDEGEEKPRRSAGSAGPRARREDGDAPRRPSSPRPNRGGGDAGPARGKGKREAIPQFLDFDDDVSPRKPAGRGKPSGGRPAGPGRPSRGRDEGGDAPRSRAPRGEDRPASRAPRGGGEDRPASRAPRGGGEGRPTSRAPRGDDRPTSRAPRGGGEDRPASRARGGGEGRPASRAPRGEGSASRPPRGGDGERPSRPASRAPRGGEGERPAPRGPAKGGSAKGGKSFGPAKPGARGGGKGPGREGPRPPRGRDRG